MRFVRFAAAGLALSLLTSIALGEAPPPEPPPAAPEPHKDDPQAAPTAPPSEDEAHRGYDGEADYLALADTPTFLPRSYLYWGTPVGAKGHHAKLVFALEYALHLPIYSNLRSQALTGKHWAGATTLTFEGDLRMIDSESKPVRMPSYRPNISGQVFYIWHRKAPVLFGGRVGAFHYSNGQERCTFDANLPDDSAACAAATAAVTNPVAQLNRVTGNFATNGYLIEANARLHETNSKGVAIGHLSAGMGAQGLIHHGAAALDTGLRRLYGWGRLQWNLEAKKRFGWASVTARFVASYYPGTHGNTPTKSGICEVVIAPFWLTGIGFFGRYYGGRDYYNAFFVDNIQQFSAGLSWDGERPLKFKRD